MAETIEHVDVLIIGTGISGIGAAVYLQMGCAGKSYAILERRPTFMVPLPIASRYGG